MNTKQSPVSMIRISDIDYKKDSHVVPSFQLEAKILNIKQRINEGLHSSIIENLVKLEQIIDMFDILVMRSFNYISVYNKLGLPLIINPAFLDLIGYDEEDITQMIRRKVSIVQLLYKDKNLEKVNRYLGMIVRGEIDGYKNVPFTVTDRKGEDHSVLWSNFGLPDGTNMRIGAQVTPDYGAFFNEEIIPLGTCNVGEFLPVSAKIADAYADIRKSIIGCKKLCHRSSDVDTVKNDIALIFHNIRLMGLMVDILVQEGGVPIVMYEGSEPVFLNKRFLDICGYTRGEIMRYYQQYGEVQTLFYKGPDLENVRNKLSTISGVRRGGYKDVEFTLTRNPALGGQRITLAWTTYNWSNDTKTLRSARFVRIEPEPS